MKKLLRTSAIACVLISLSIGLSTAARAEENSELVRTAQIRLADLGYYVGRTDGVMGAVTKDALIAFQRHDGLPVTGQLTAQTYNLLTHGDYAGITPLHYAAYRYDNSLYYPENYVGSSIITESSPVWNTGIYNAEWNNGTWNNGMHYAYTQGLPSRFASVSINEGDHGALRDYAVTVNGRAILFANNQPYVLRVSQTFALGPNEDAVIVTARQGQGACTYKNYLLTVRRDGLIGTPREVGNCSAAYEAHVADNSLVVSFPTAHLAHGIDAWDMWRYENGSLVRI